MNDMNSVAGNSAQVSRTTEYERSRQVKVSREVLNERGARTEIARKTTTQQTTEITKIRRQLESKIRELNQKLDALGRSEAQFKLADTEPVVQLVDEQAGFSFDLQSSVDEFLAGDPTAQSGLLLDTVT